MERVRGIGGTFLKARDPDALAQWYAQALGIELTDWGGAVFLAAEDDATVWSLFPASTRYFGSDDQQAMLNYRVRDLDAMLAQLRATGADVEDQVHEDENGRFGWATDPEGNRFELWEPRPGTRRRLSA